MAIYSHKEKRRVTATTNTTTTTTTTTTTSTATATTQSVSGKMGMACANPSCFFCIMKEPESSVRRVGIKNCFREIPLTDDQEHVLVLSGLFNIAMTQPDDPEFPSLGIFHCMASLINRAISDKDWLLRHQNVYIPYYAAHVIGSYTMNKVEFAEMAVQSGVIPPLMELLRGKLTWVEQRVAVRALGHLASYERTFESVAEYEEEVVELAMQLASTCLDMLYAEFVGVNDDKLRLKYHGDLLTRGIGGTEMENRKAEEWASQLQCWSLYLLNCFSYQNRAINLICRQDFLKDLCQMWGGMVNHSSPAGVGLIRILCYHKTGRKSIAESKEVVESLCNLSRSSDDWQYMGIDCLLLLLRDRDTRYRVMEIAILFLVDLVELRNLGGRSNVGEAITRTLLLEYNQTMSKLKQNRVAQRALEEIWVLKLERRRIERMMSNEKVEERKVLVSLIKQQGNQRCWLGEVEEAVAKYSEALAICPLRLRKERVVLYSNRAQCYLLLGDPDAAIRDTTRALSLSTPPNSHRKSLWRRSQAYDMKGLGKESLMDCIMFINGCINSETSSKRIKVPYFAARMISKQMEATWLFSAARSNLSSTQQNKRKGQEHEMMRGMMEMEMENKTLKCGLSTIMEEPLNLIGMDESKRKLEMAKPRNKAVGPPST